MTFDSLIREMITKYGSRIKSDGYIIGFEGKVWRLHDETPLRVLNSIAKEIGYTKRRIWDDYYSFISAIRDMRPDVFVGEVEGTDTLKIEKGNYSHTFTSRLVRKIMDHYDLKYLEIGDSDHWVRGQFFNRWDTGKIDYDKVYHGTCLKHLPHIMAFGLTPVEHGNWGDIKFKDRVFLTVDYSEAVFHAARSAKRNRSFPIILEVSIPDKNLIVPDYDMVNTFERKELAHTHGYSHHRKIDTTHSAGTHKSKIRDINNVTGIFAYRGRIPARFINQMYFFNGGTFGDDSEEDYQVSNYAILPKDMLHIYARQIEDYGEFYGFDYDPEENED